MMSKAAVLAPVAMALLAGAVLPFQAAANSTIGRMAGHPLWAALVSLGVSLLVIVPTLALLRAPTPQTTAVLNGPWWLWIGGVLGAIYVAAAASVTPKLGAGGFLVCVVAGQMVAAVVVDHYGMMGLASKPISLQRIAGVALILCGVFLIQGLGPSLSRKSASTSVKH
ncbi:DMT family transporter [Rhizobacter sp. P5_C2]